MKVMVGAPVRNRAWILPRYCEALLKQDVEFETCFVVNNCTDKTEEILQNYGFHVVKHDLENPLGHRRENYSFANIAECRNVLIEEFLKSDCDYLVSIDSDIIIPDGSLRALVEHDKDIVSMFVPLAKDKGIYNVLECFLVEHGRWLYRHFTPNNGVIKTDITCAVVAIKRKVLELGVRYGHHSQGEDVYFCEMARDNGFTLHCDTSLTPIHCYDEEGTELIATL